MGLWGGGGGVVLASLLDLHNLCDIYTRFWMCTFQVDTIDYVYAYYMSVCEVVPMCVCTDDWLFQRKKICFLLLLPNLKTMSRLFGWGNDSRVLSQVHPEGSLIARQLFRHTAKLEQMKIIAFGLPVHRLHVGAWACRAFASVEGIFHPSSHRLDHILVFLQWQLMSLVQWWINKASLRKHIIPGVF